MTQELGPRVHLTPEQRFRGGLDPWPELIEGPSRRAVLREVGRAVAAGELAASGPLEHAGGGRYRVAVWRIRERAVAPAWRRPVLVVAGTVVVLGGLAALGWWLAGMATAALSAVSVPLVATVAALLWLASRALSSSSGGGCETTVTVTHRHRS